MKGKTRIGFIYEENEGEDARMRRIAGVGEIAAALKNAPYEAVALAIPSQGLPSPAVFSGTAAVLPAPGGSREGIRRIVSLAAAAGLPSAGFSLKSAALDGDQWMLRRLLGQSKVPQAVFRCFSRSQWGRDKGYCVTEMEVTLGYPCRVRPASGSFVPDGTPIHNREELERAVASVLAEDRQAVVEELVEGRIFAASLLGDEGSIPEVSAIGELLPGQSPDAIAVYPTEWQDGDRDAASQTAETVRQTALQVWSALAIGGPVLLWFVEAREEKRILLSGAELLPDLGPGGLYSRLWERSGKSYPALIASLVTRHSC